jgi:hypothetical protein
LYQKRVRRYRWISRCATGIYITIGTDSAAGPAGSSYIDIRWCRALAAQTPKGGYGRSAVTKRCITAVSAWESSDTATATARKTDNIGVSSRRQKSKKLIRIAARTTTASSPDFAHSSFYATTTGTTAYKLH